MAVAKKPQDHKPKAEALEVFTFTHGDEVFTLPGAETIGDLVSGKTMRDAVMGGEEGQLRLAFFMLEKLEGVDDAIEALYSKPAGDMLVIIEAWMRFKPKAGVSLGE